MTDNEIIKALECCSQEDMCQSCPYGAACLDEKYVSILSKDSLDLINRQKAEIVRLHIRLKDGIDLSDNVLKLVKSEAIKEFAERLERVISISAAQKPYFDNLVEEMAGDVHGT